MTDMDYIDAGRVMRHKIPPKEVKLYKEFDCAPFFGSVETDMGDSNMGALASQEVWLMDLWHESDGREEYIELLNERNKEELHEAYRRSHDQLRQLRDFLENEDLHLIAQEVINHKAIEQVARGGTCEELAAKKAAEKLDADEYLLTSSAIAAETGVREPESAGIDVCLMIDGEPVTLQVKMDDGGDMPDDCEADKFVRINTETGRVRILD
jgi:hypothetical protein